MKEKLRVTAREPIRGTTHRMIVVKPPDSRIFKEAVFILRDDYFSEGVSEKQLLREAREAARAYTASVLPRRTGFSAAAAVFAAIMLVLGIILLKNLLYSAPI